MTFSNIIEIILLIFLLFFTAIIFTTIFGVIKPYLETKNKLRSLEVENKSMELYMKMDPKMADQEVDNFIENYLNKYVVDNFIVNNIDYIKKEQIEKMVRDLDKIVLFALPDLYIFYIKMNVNIIDEDDLISYINRKVKEHVLVFVTEFNKPR